MYDPSTYWPERAASQGEYYVAKGGDPASYRQQVEAIGPFLHGLRRHPKIGSGEGGRVLDFGCGPERFRPALEGLGLTYEGVDPIPQYGTVEPADVAISGYVAAVAIFVLQHVVDEGEYLSAVGMLHGALEPGGLLFAVDHLPNPDVEWADHMRPRGVDGILGTGYDWEPPTMLGTDDGHWVATFRKPGP